MGYRSQVCLSVSEEADKILKDNADMIPALKELLKDGDSRVAERYYWDSVKWYPSYPEIDALERFLCFMDSADDGQYGFIRLGEEEDDIERRGAPWEFDMHVTRGISW